MDYDNLNESEITTLINNKKEPKNQEQYDQMYNEVITTLFSQRHSNRTVVLDTLDDNIDYILTTNQTPIETRFTIALILKTNQYTLVRFDFGETLKHTNNFGTDNEEVIKGSHVHIYCAPSKYSPKNVYPVASIPNLQSITLIKNAFLEFISYTKIN